MLVDETGAESLRTHLTALRAEISQQSDY
jgi:hypothetical protein